MNPSFSHIQMVAIDCDETLLRSDNTVSEYTKDVLHQLQEKGIRITIATGACTKRQSLLACHCSLVMCR